MAAGSFLIFLGLMIVAWRIDELAKVIESNNHHQPQKGASHGP